MAGGSGAGCEPSSWEQEIWACRASSLVFVKPRSRRAGWVSTAELSRNSKKKPQPAAARRPRPARCSPGRTAAEGVAEAVTGEGAGRFPVARGRAAPGTRLRHTSGRQEAFLLRNPPGSSDALCFHSGKLQ